MVAALVRVDRPESGDSYGVGAADLPGEDNELPSDGTDAGQFDVPSVEEYRAEVDAVYRKYAIDQGCARVREVEENVTTPAMRRIESEDPGRHLVGLDHRLKSEDRLSEKVGNWMDAEPTLTAEAAFSLLKDSIRYTFEYREDRYADGVGADCERLEGEGFELVERRNSWGDDQYKGINSRWREPDSGQLFEVQFHTEASFEAKQETHWAYEKLRSSSTTEAEQDELVEYQRRVTGRVETPPGALDVPGYP